MPKKIIFPTKKMRVKFYLEIDGNSILSKTFFFLFAEKEIFACFCIYTRERKEIAYSIFVIFDVLNQFDSNYKYSSLPFLFMYNGAEQPSRRNSIDGDFNCKFAKFILIHYYQMMKYTHRFTPIETHPSKSNHLHEFNGFQNMLNASLFIKGNQNHLINSSFAWLFDMS